MSIEKVMFVSLSKERQRFKVWIEEHPPIVSPEGWICPLCEDAHRYEDDAVECCMPDEQDADCQKYHNKKE